MAKRITITGRAETLLQRLVERAHISVGGGLGRVCKL
jgi:hypothetical protein